MMAIIKYCPEDFLVTEIPLRSQKGNSSYYLLKKREYTTVRAIGVIAREVNLHPKEIGFAGNKDKKAVTTQFISIKNVSRDHLEHLNLKDISLTFHSSGNAPLHLGDLEGNKFEIVIRDLTGEESEQLQQKCTATLTIPNIFGPQRFSTENVSIGLLLLKKKFAEAMERIIEKDPEYQKEIAEFLKRHPNDVVNSLKLIPEKIGKMYVHAVQSLLWNQTVKRGMEKGIHQEKIPLVGFDYEKKDSEVDRIIEDLMVQNNLTERDFICKEIPFLTSPGGERSMVMTVHVLCTINEDEIFNGKKKAILTFTLPKSSYATVVVDYLLH